MANYLDRAGISKVMSLVKALIETKTVTFTQALTSGTKVGTLSINGTNTDLYAPADTKNTAGATDASCKLFLIGATAQGANPQTYSHDTAYVGADGCLYSGGEKVNAGYTFKAVSTAEIDAAIGSE